VAIMRLWCHVCCPHKSLSCCNSFVTVEEHRRRPLSLCSISLYFWLCVYVGCKVFLFSPLQ
jgi:hypothetical protein